MNITDADIEAVLRLLAASAIGMIIGLNRDLHNKPTGMRTLGLVCMGATLVSLAALRVNDVYQHADATSRVIQGILQGVLTGVGFLGAGVVLRDPGKRRVHGLTTAATVWVTAALGIVCALADWHLIVLGLVITILLLTMAHPLERFIEGFVPRRERREEPLSPHANSTADPHAPTGLPPGTGPRP